MTKTGFSALSYRKVVIIVMEVFHKIYDLKSDPLLFDNAFNVYIIFPIKRPLVISL